MADYFSANDIDRRPVIISRSQARADPRLYERLKAEAVDRGVALEIVDDAEYNSRMGIKEPKLEPVELDDDGLAVDENGRRYLPISRSQARDFQQYNRLREKAISLGAQWQIVDDPSPEAA